MTDDTTDRSAIDAELARLAPKITKAAKAKPAPTKLKTAAEFTLSTETPSALTTEAEPMRIELAPIHAMTVKESRALATIKRTPRPYVQYTQEKADLILSLMSEGMMLVEICEREDLPSMAGVWQWRQRNADFDMKLSRAREALGDQFAWEVRRVADDSTAATSPADRIKMDAYRWLAAKMYPKQYGDKTVQELTGTVVHETKHVIDATALSAENLDQLERVLRSVAALPAPIEGERE